jgi:PAB-dependent poly(A)-specific ribonuclease subunit 3
MSDKLREDLQRRSEAALQFIPNSQLPSVDHYHTLVALDTSHHKSVAVFAYPSWVYKATSSKNGNSYCLRRLEGYRLTNEKAIRSVKDWKRVDCGGVVSVHDAFTTRAFGDSSLIIVTDYHPLSKTLADAHIASPARYNRASSSAIAETVLWNYIVQIASAIKSVHAANLAVRCLEPSKVLLTDKNRVRLSACGVLDVVMFETAKPLGDLQAEDLVSFGRLILSIATHTALTPAPNAIKGAMEQFGRSYGAEMRDAVMWLVTPAPAPAPQQQTAVSQTQAKSIDQFLQKISGHVLATLDSAFHTHDSLTSELCRELENGRLARLLLKLGTINDRPEHAGDPSWSQSGDRYLLSLFRDYVFHQVDAQGNAVVDLAHMISALNKLDAGSEEKVLLTSRDEQSVFVVSYRELKKLVAGAFGELGKGVAKGGRGY